MRKVVIRMKIGRESEGSSGMWRKLCSSSFMIAESGYAVLQAFTNSNFTSGPSQIPMASLSLSKVSFSPYTFLEFHLTHLLFFFSYTLSTLFPRGQLSWIALRLLEILDISFLDSRGYFYVSNGYSSFSFLRKKQIQDKKPLLCCFVLFSLCNFGEILCHHVCFHFACQLLDM